MEIIQNRTSCIPFNARFFKMLDTYKYCPLTGYLQIAINNFLTISNTIHIIANGEIMYYKHSRSIVKHLSRI